MPDWLALILDIAAVGFVITSATLLMVTLLVGRLRRRREGRRRDQPS